jgi:23S rRNA (guanosine2251-2'-O)-methyltransferase
MKPPYRGGRPSGGASTTGGPRGTGSGPRGPGDTTSGGPSRGPSDQRGGPRRDAPGRDAPGRDQGARDQGGRDHAARPAPRSPAGGDARPQQGRSEQRQPAADRPYQDRSGPDRKNGDRAPERGHSDRGPSGRGKPERGQLRPAESAERPNRLVAPRAAPSHAAASSGREGRGEPARPEAPKGTVWLYGMHAVAGALANPARRLRRLVLTEEAYKSLAALLPPPWSIQPERAERARIDHLLGRDAVHQGVALLADPLAPPALAAVLERPGPVLVLDQVVDPRNVGAILRSAAAFGIAAVITQERNAPDETGALAKAASGALEKIPLLRAVNIARTLIALKAAGCWVVGLAADGKPLSGPALAERRVALVLGSEGEGLRRLTRDTCDEIAGIAMPRGHASEMESLNVSAATAVALYELGRQG